MRFKTNVTDLLQALEVASLIQPNPVDAEGSAGYLMLVRGDRCFLYSAGDHQKCRVDFPITDVEGEGAFVLPTKGISAYRSLDGWVQFEPLVESGTHRLMEESESGSTDTITTFDPRSLHSIDKDFESAEAGVKFPVALLKEAITLGRTYMADANDASAKPHLKAMQIYDGSKEEWEKGNGNFFSSDGRRAMYFYCESFVDKGLSIPGGRIGLLNSFLSKSEGEIELRKSKNTTYLVNSKDQVIGWSDQVTSHGKYSYFPLAGDKFVLHAPKEVLLKKLTYVKDKMGSGSAKIRIAYDSKTECLTFTGSTGANRPESTLPVVPRDPEDLGEGRGGKESKEGAFAFNVNAHHLLELVSPLKTQNVELRFCPSAGDNSNFFLRTVEEFTLNGKGKVSLETNDGEETYPCRVTRFMLSMR